jgi:hypothetical protein
MDWQDQVVPSPASGRRKLPPYVRGPCGSRLAQFAGTAGHFGTIGAVAMVPSDRRRSSQSVLTDHQAN